MNNKIYEFFYILHAKISAIDGGVYPQNNLSLNRNRTSNKLLGWVTQPYSD